MSLKSALLYCLMPNFLFIFGWRLFKQLPILLTRCPLPFFKINHHFQSSLTSHLHTHIFGYSFVLVSLFLDSTTNINLISTLANAFSWDITLFIGGIDVYILLAAFIYFDMLPSMSQSFHILPYFQKQSHLPLTLPIFLYPLLQIHYESFQCSPHQWRPYYNHLLQPR